MPTKTCVVASQYFVLLTGYIRKRVIFFVSRSHSSVKTVRDVHLACKAVTKDRGQAPPRFFLYFSLFGWKHWAQPTSWSHIINPHLRCYENESYLSVKFMAAIFVMLPIYIIYIDIKHPLVTHGYPCQHLSPLKIKIEASKIYFKLCSSSNEERNSWTGN